MWNAWAPLQTNLFVERHHTLYKSQDTLDWLIDGAKIAHDRVLKRSTFQGVAVEDWTCVRTAAFPPDDQNHFGYTAPVAILSNDVVSCSHLHLYDFSDDVNRLPEDVLRGDGAEDARADLERRMAQEIEQHGHDRDPDGAEASHRALCCRGDRSNRAYETGRSQKCESVDRVLEVAASVGADRRKEPTSSKRCVDAVNV